MQLERQTTPGWTPKGLQPERHECEELTVSSYGLLSFRPHPLVHATRVSVDRRCIGNKGGEMAGGDRTSRFECPVALRASFSWPRSWHWSWSESPCPCL